MTNKEYEKVMNNILKVCEKYPAVFDKLDGKCLEIFEIFVAQDETDRIGIIKTNNNKFSYIARYYEGGNPMKYSIDMFKQYKVAPNKILAGFLNHLKGPLGQALAEKEISRLEKKLLK